MNDNEKLLRDYIRMCRDSIGDCDHCAIGRECERGRGCEGWIIKHIEEAVKIIEKWGAKHPVKTRRDLFLERYTNSSPKRICPKFVDGIDCELRYFNGETYKCDECMRDYWSQEVD